MGKGGDDPNCQMSSGMGALLSSDRNIVISNLAPALKAFLALDRDKFDFSWITDEMINELDESLMGAGYNDSHKVTLSQIAQILGLRNGSDQCDIACCMLTRWLRANGYTKGFVRDYLRFKTGANPRLETIEKWCEEVGFQLPWSSRTESQPLRDGPEEYEAQRRRWQQMVGDTRELIRRTRRGAKAARRYHGKAESELRDEIGKSFHKIALHRMGGPDSAMMEKLVTHGAVEDLMKEIAHQHTRGVTLIEKPLEDGLAHAFQVGSELEIRPRGDRTAKADIEVIITGDNTKIQVKSSASYSPDKQQEHTNRYENETKPFEFTLFSTGDKKAQDTKRMASEAAERIDNIDVYMLANVFHENQGLTPDDAMDTTKYAIDVLRREAKLEIAGSLKKHDFAHSKNHWIEGTIQREGKPVPWRAEAYLEPSTNSVKLRNISAACMETVATITVPSPEACQAIIAAKSYQFYRAAKDKLNKLAA